MMWRADSITKSSRTRGWLPIVGVLAALCALTYVPASFFGGKRGSGTRTTGKGGDGGQCSDVDLLQWATSRGVYADKITVADFAFENGEADGKVWTQRLRWRRGVMATKSITRGEPIVVVPHNMVLSIDTAKQTELAPVLARFPRLTAHEVLALFVLHEHTKGPASDWWPYLCSLPTSYHFSLWWSRERLESVEGGENSTLVKMTKGSRRTLLLQYNRLFPLLFREFPSMFDPERFTFKRWLWASSAVYSRNWASPDTGLIKGNVMAPVADLFNHHLGDMGAVKFLKGTWKGCFDECTDMLACDEIFRVGSSQHKQCMGTRCYETCGPGSDEAARGRWREDGGVFAIIAGHNYTAGQEVFTSYGSNCNDHYLWSYGFSIPDNTQPCTHGGATQAKGGKRPGGEL